MKYQLFEYRLEVGEFLTIETDASFQFVGIDSICQAGRRRKVKKFVFHFSESLSDAPLVRENGWAENYGQAARIAQQIAEQNGWIVRAVKHFEDQWAI